MFIFIYFRIYDFINAPCANSSRHLSFLGTSSFSRHIHLRTHIRIMKMHYLSPRSKSLQNSSYPKLQQRQQQHKVTFSNVCAFRKTLTSLGRPSRCATAFPPTFGHNHYFGVEIRLRINDIPDFSPVFLLRRRKTTGSFSLRFFLRQKRPICSGLD